MKQSVSYDRSTFWQGYHVNVLYDYQTMLYYKFLLYIIFLLLMLKAFEARERCGLMYMNALLFSDLLEI